MARLDCLTKLCDIIHMIVWHQNISQMDLSGVYTVCLTFSLLWENQILNTKLGKNIKEIKYNFDIFSNGSYGYVQNTLMTAWLTFHFCQPHDIMVYMV